MNTAGNNGFVLTELLISGLLAAFLMLGIVQMAAGVSRGLLLLESQSDVSQGGRYAIDQVRDTVMSAGFNPTPWEPGSRIIPLGEATLDGGSGASDVLMLRQLSDRNCYGNTNSATDGQGNPVFYLRESKFDVTPSGNLAHTCWFGPQGGPMVRQINRQGIVQHVETFQVLYAEDTDGDRHANRLVRANHWNDIEQVVGLEVGFLVTTDQPVGGTSPTSFSVLDERISPPPDGRLRKTWITSIPLVSRLR